MGDIVTRRRNGTCDQFSLIVSGRRSAGLELDDRRKKEVKEESQGGGGG